MADLIFSSNQIYIKAGDSPEAIVEELMGNKYHYTEPSNSSTWAKLPGGFYIKNSKKTEGLALEERGEAPVPSDELLVIYI